MKEIETLTWYLEMNALPEIHLKTDLSKLGYAISEFRDPKVEDYLSVYRSVGEHYHWVDRLIMSTEKLKETIHDPMTEILLLRNDYEIAGFSELNHSSEKETEIVYFGLSQGHLGKGLGLPFLKDVITYAWSKQIKRLWLHTCDLDHPAALPLYQKAGFVVYKTERIMQPLIHGK